MEEVARTVEATPCVNSVHIEGNGKQIATGLAAPPGSHIIMQAPVPAASRRPETEEGIEKVKGGSDGGFPERVEDAGAAIRQAAQGFSGFVEEVTLSPLDTHGHSYLVCVACQTH